MEVGRLIATSRRRAGLSQRELARRAGTSSAAISLYESAKREPRVDTLRRILEATGATLELNVTHSIIDITRNGSILEALLDLADHLPKRSDQTLSAPIFAQLAV